MNFEENNTRLAEIVKQLEKSNLSLEDGMKLYEEGVQIAKESFEYLKNCKGKLTFLKEQVDAFDEQTE